MGEVIEYIDTHSHIYLEDFDNDRSEVLDRAIKNSVNTIILPAIDSKSYDAMWQCYNLNTKLQRMMIGVHPESVNENYTEELIFIENELKHNHKSYVGIGEIGIDLYWDNTFLIEQKIVLQQQLQWSIDYNLPVCIHQRNSLKEIMEILDDFSEELRGVFHCFTGSIDEAIQIVERGFYLGIGGVITFKNSKLSETIKKIGLENLVLETDAPYLTPVPYRGKRNESSYIPIIANKIADILNVNIDIVSAKTTANAKKLFSL
ncbi:MAG TPA: TatD family hydrolase [Bacteroidales bacterium]|nr:TatD family hydrolase [Bacteroidales bacterium]